MTVMMEMVNRSALGKVHLKSHPSMFPSYDTSPIESTMNCTYSLSCDSASISNLYVYEWVYVGRKLLGSATVVVRSG